VLPCLLVVFLVAGCGGDDQDLGAQETDIAVAVAWTVAAAAEQTSSVITVVVTPVPPAATDTAQPTLPPVPLPTASPPAATEAPPPPSTSGGSTRITLSPGGGGDYPSLAEAIRNAPAGATIVLEPGLYPLEEAITVDRALSLEGADAEDSVILSSAPEHVIKFEGAGPFSAYSVVFRHEGSQPANVVVVLGGEASFSFCTFTGGTFSADAGYGGNGLFVGGTTSGEVLFSEINDNDQQGILLREGAHMTLESNNVHHNGSCGIGYFGNSHGYAQYNTANANSLHGICLSDSAMPLLEGNTCRFNQQSGIAYFADSGGGARYNDCSLNGRDGIASQGQAQPVLEYNDCLGNSNSDIGFFENAGGTARGNHCSTDSAYGFYVADSAGPFLEDNRCPLMGAATQAGGAGLPQPRYNPDFLQGYGPICFSSPQPAIDREWQTACGTRQVVLGDSVELSLRNKWGEPGEAYDVTVRVVDPEGTETRALISLVYDEEGIAIYPDDFASASSESRGAYTVIWEINGGFVACDGFDVFGGASW
jgi:parallel beta-helix repeat protein